MAQYLPFPVNAVELDDIVDSAINVSPSQVLPEDDKARFLRAIDEGDLEYVRRELNGPSASIVDVNETDSEGKTPLQIASTRGHGEVVKELVEHGADLRRTLLRAVLDNNRQQIEILLSASQGHASKAQGADDYQPSALALASEHGYYDIVMLLLDYGQVIAEPHKYACDCERCRVMADVHRSQRAVNDYRGLCSPDYMCATYISDKRGNRDPVTQAFELNVRLQQRADDEPELKGEYLALSQRCKRFGVALLNECRSMSEITALLNVDEKYFDPSGTTKIKKQGQQEVSRSFNRAVNSFNREFVAHPHTQQLLSIVVYSGFNKLKKMSLPIKLILFLFYTVTFPIFAGIQLVAPHHWISRSMRTPIAKLISHTSQFIVFLALLTAAALRDNHKPSALEYLIFIFILAMAIQECLEFYRHRPRRSYFLKWWNVTITAMLVLFALAFVLWVIGFAITREWSVLRYSPVRPEGRSGHELLLLGNSLFSVATVLSFFHLLDLCQVSMMLGPLQLSLYRMMRDVMKFLLFFFAIFIAFSVGVRNLYSYYNSVITDISKEYVARNDTVPKETEVHPMSTFEASTLTMFWALFDKIDLNEFDTSGKTFQITQETGKVLFALYSIFAVMVALNMLIAMMSRSYELTTEDEDIQWKFSRTRLWLEFIGKGSTLPPPYNLIPHPKLIYRLVTTCMGFVTCSNGEICQADRAREQNEQQREAKRKRILENLIRRYFAKRESRRKTEACTLDDLETFKKQILEEVRSTMRNNGKQNI